MIKGYGSLEGDWDSYFNKYQQELEAVAAELEENLNAISTQSAISTV